MKIYESFRSQLPGSFTFLYYGVIVRKRVNINVICQRNEFIVKLSGFSLKLLAIIDQLRFFFSRFLRLSNTLLFSDVNLVSTLIITLKDYF